MVRLFLCCIVALNVCSSLPAQEKRLALDEAGGLSRLEFRNADVRIKSWLSKVPDDPKLADLATEIEMTVHAVVDYENEKCFWLAKSKRSNASGSANNTEISYVSYHDGKGISSPSDYRPIGIDQSEFFRYLGVRDVWRIELAGAAGCDRPSTLSPQALSDANMEFRKSILIKTSKIAKFSDRTLPDGTTQFIEEWPNGYPKMITTYDPKFIFPISQSHARLDKGKEVVDYKLRSEFELVDGFTRGKSLECEATIKMSNDVGEDVPAKEVKTIEFKWLQFNSDSLEWPDERQIMSSSKEQMKYLTE